MLPNQYQTHPKLKYFNEFVINKDPKEDYKLIKNIGSGTYGEVYKGIQRKSGLQAAVKIVKIDLKDDVKAIAQEIHTLRECSHPNIVEYFGSYLRRNKLWICMEFCGGFSLQDIYTNIRRPLDELTIAYVTRETLKGLSYMHLQGKIHRDIKGANILLTEDGLVKIADFGVAAQISETIQKRQSFIGTPYWMAPEVAAVAKKGGYDEKCDIWAVGITAIEYAELQPPMFDLHPLKALQILSQRNYKPPVLQNKHKWTSKFHNFLKICLNKNEKRRPNADAILKNEFVNHRGLGEHLTRALLLLNKNPGQLPLVPNEEDDDDADSANVGTLNANNNSVGVSSGSSNNSNSTSNSNINNNNNNNIVNNSGKSNNSNNECNNSHVKNFNKQNMPLAAEKIRSIRRSSKRSCIEDIVFQFHTNSEAPICAPEDSFTMAAETKLKKPSDDPPETPTTPTDETSAVTPTFSSSNIGRHETNIELLRKMNSSLRKIPSTPPVVRNKELEAFSAYNDDTGEDKSSEISNDSPDSSPPTPPPKRSLVPPPLPPLPNNRRHVRGPKDNHIEVNQDSVFPRRNSSIDLVDYSEDFGNIRSYSQSDNGEQRNSVATESNYNNIRNDIIISTPRQPPPLPDNRNRNIPPPLPPHKARSSSAFNPTRTASVDDCGSSSGSANDPTSSTAAAAAASVSVAMVTSTTDTNSNSSGGGFSGGKSSKDRKGRRVPKQHLATSSEQTSAAQLPSSSSSTGSTPSTSAADTRQQKVEQQEESLLDQSRKKALGYGLPLTPRVPMGACFSLIFEGCPLKINCSATWVNPITNAQTILLGTNEGIYYLNLDELADMTLNLLFPRRCMWLYVVRNTMISLSGPHPQLFHHNLVIMFKLHMSNQSVSPNTIVRYSKLLPKRFMPTTKVQDTKGCQMASVVRNPYNGAKYLCAALNNQILVMEWFPPVAAFMEVRRVRTASLPRPLLNFELLIFQKKTLPVVCLGVYPSNPTSSYAFKFHLLDLNPISEDVDIPTVDSVPPSGIPLIVNKMVQLEFKTILIAFQKSVVITDLRGHPKTSKTQVSELHFPNGVESIVCLSDTVLAFNQHGFTGKGFTGKTTQEIYDETSLYQLIGSDKNIVVEKRPTNEPMNDSNIYVLAGHTDSI